ncbi:MAG: hypothetical protein JJU45_14380 [Acidimicrobiia bacterium]|nr:hypothetical protein [Acidimicrobiia bacterium]
MKVTRAIVLLAVPALVAAALVFDERAEPPEATGVTAMAQLMPTVGGEDAGSSIWFCPAGTAAGDEGGAEQTLIVANTAEEAVEATVTAYPDEGQPVTTTVALDARSRTTVEVSDLVTSPFAAALVEAPVAGVAVEHQLSGPLGTTSGPCASAVSSEWYVPTGTSVLGVQSLLAVFNPFPSPAVVDITVETDLDTRNPPELQGFVVEPQSVRVVDVAEVVTVRQQLSMQVVARSGLVAVEQLEVVTDESDLPAGITTALGAPRAAETWYFPVGQPLEATGDVAVDMVVYNPSEDQAEVDVQVLVDDPTLTGFVEPFEVSIRGGQFTTISLHREVRMPAGVAWGAYVQSRNDVPVVPAIAVTAGAPSPLETDTAAEDPEPTEEPDVPAEPDEPEEPGEETDGEAVDEVAGLFASPPPDGRAITLGAPLVATEWLVPSAPGGSDLSSTSIQNPSATADAVVEILRVADGAAEVVATVDVPAGTRISLLDAGETPADDAAEDETPEDETPEDETPEEGETDPTEEEAGEQDPAEGDTDEGEAAAPAEPDTDTDVETGPDDDTATEDRRPVRVDPVVGVDDGGAGFLFRSDTDVVVGTVRVFDDQAGLALAAGLPVLGTTALPTPAVSDPDAAPTVILDGLDLPLDDEAPPETEDPGGTGEEPAPDAGAADDTADEGGDPAADGQEPVPDDGGDSGTETTAPATDEGG